MHTLVPRGAHHNREMHLIIDEIKGLIYRVLVHNMQTGELVMSHELKRPCEPNSTMTKAEFSPRIGFSIGRDLLHLTEETYVSPDGVLDNQKRTIEPYG